MPKFAPEFAGCSVSSPAAACSGTPTTRFASTSSSAPKQLIGEGMSPAAARAEAERRFGEVDDERRRSRASAARQERRLRWRDSFDLLRGDLRYAFRTLRRDAGFTAFALAIMALGIGASATVFSLVNGVLLRPMPFRDPSRLVWIGNIGDNGVDEWRVQVAHFVDLGARSRSLERHRRLLRLL